MITIHTDWPERGYTPNIIEAFRKRGVLSDDGDIVLNIDSIHNTKLRKGKKLTLYWEIEDYRLLGSNPDFYNVDILYIGHKRYLPYYPKNTKVMYLACDPEYHKPHPTQKPIFDLVFIGGIEYIPSYEERINFIHDMQMCGRDFAIMYGKREDYTRYTAMGRKILNFLHKINGNTQINTKVFEAMAMGCLVNNYDSILDELFTPMVHYVPYLMLDTVTEQQAERIKKQSREYVVNNHTWDHRVTQVLNDIYEFKR